MVVKEKKVRNKFALILAIFVGMVLISIVIVATLNMHENEYSRVSWEKYVNNGLPRKIGTVGWLNSVRFYGDTLVYSGSVDGDASVDTLYENHQSEISTLLLYGYVIMNGTKHMGDTFVKFLETEDLHLSVRITTPRPRTFEWTFTPSEISDFVLSCQKTPTEALSEVIDMQVRLAGQNLPVIVDSLGNVQNITTNSIKALSNEGNTILVDIRHSGNNIEFVCVISEEEFQNFQNLENLLGKEYIADVLAKELATDADFREWMNMLAISHSDLILNYRGQSSQKQISIRLPYYIIKEYCTVPKYLLSNT